MKLPKAPARAVLKLKPARSLASGANLQRTFVSTSGLDSNLCSPDLPCRTFGAAIANTVPGGEVVAVSSGGYAPFAIGMDVTIIGAPGVHAAITVRTGNGIEVNAGATDTVVLRNLYVNGLGGDSGIVYSSGYALILEQITATGFTNGSGVRLLALNGRLHANDSSLRRNRYGLLVDPPGFSGLAAVTLDRIQARENNSVGIYGNSNARLRISNSIAAGNNFGIVAAVPTMVSGCQLSENTTGLYVTAGGGGGGLGRIGGSTVTNNASGLVNNGATLESFGDNLVRGNTTADTSGAISTVAKT
jgi:hypothetical protein